MATQVPRTRRMMQAGEWFTLLGMAVAVAGVGLTWAREAPAATTVFAAEYISQRSYLRAGYDVHLGPLNVGWTVVALALTSGALLLWEAEGRGKRIVLGIQAALALGIVGLAGSRLGPQPGVILTLIGALCLLWGVAARFGKEADQQ